ncbi:hypothetical protein [Streptococcus saliviloxodontae]|uniref:Antitoxin n=1 Tax=Streptococcus saliviloxodontae TaxID=1349416 RepID=A0ABS2PJH6_9STRE|nr:hypothetical protein [Streptococcus saliviloxodontae]MBM7635580.1 hypothetical protein [Streptococcus saliviloxodontae]
MADIINMFPKKNASPELAKARAESFGRNLDEAYGIMVDFALEDKFEAFSLEEEIQLDRVLEILMDFSIMWNEGQIIVSSEARGLDNDR